MAFDGIVMANVASEIRSRIKGGKISKIAQPEKDELLFTIKNNRLTWRLLISASASLPFLYFTESNKQSPLTAPNFCMLLRKHIGSGRIIEVSQPGLERIICLTIEHLDELGDLCHKKLMIEMMGKHSNIIFCDDNDKIIDSIKHISAQISSVREVLPGRTYFIPNTINKKDPMEIQKEEFTSIIKESSASLQKTLYTNLTGISPLIAEEICSLASLDSDLPGQELSAPELLHLYQTFSYLMGDIKQEAFFPNIIYQQNEPVEFSSVPLTIYREPNYQVKNFESVSELLETFYAVRNTISRIRQKSTDLRKIVQTLLERNYKKYDLQLKQLKDTEKKDQFKVYGELLNTYGYELTGGETSLICLNYYTNEEIKIPLDSQLSAKENAQKNFDKYNKLKRTFEAITGQIADTQKEIHHLESISTALEIALKEDDLVQIKEELMEYGYMKQRHYGAKKPKIISKPFHYLSTDGFHIYVGKNNYQNEELSFQLASGNDWWFHAKGMPGSHVIVKSEGKELPDRVFEEAGALAAFYSKGRLQEKVEIDYLQKKNLKKVPGSAPGFVIYHSNYSLVASPNSSLSEVISS